MRVQGLVYRVTKFIEQLLAALAPLLRARVRVYGSGFRVWS